MGLWSNLLGTVSSYFRIGLTGPRLKDNSGRLDVRNSSDAAYADVSCDNLFPVASDSASTPSIATLANTNSGFCLTTDGSVFVSVLGSTQMLWVSGATYVSSSLLVMGDSFTDDPLLVTEANHVLAQRNTTNPQTFRLYQTHTDSSNYERMALSADYFGDNGFALVVEKAGTGSDRVLYVSNNTNSAIYFRTNNTNRWSISAGGVIEPDANNTYDIGTSSNRPRTIYAGTSVVSPEVMVTSVLTVPNGTSPTVDAAGELAIDTDADGNLIDQGLIVYHDGTQKMFVVAVDALPSNDTYVLSYDATNDKFVFAAQTGGGVTDHGALTGLSDDDHTQYPHLSGRSGNITWIGSSDGGTLSLINNETSGAQLALTSADAVVAQAQGNVTFESDAAIRFTAGTTATFHGTAVVIGGLSGFGVVPIRFMEAQANGTDYISFQSPAALSGITAYTLPDAFPAVTGYVLSCTDAGVMSWAAPSGGDWELLSSATASSSATVDFTLTGWTNSDYAAYMVVFANVAPATDGAVFWLRTSSDGGSSYDAGASDYAWVVTGTAGGTDSADNQISLTGTGAASQHGNGANELASGHVMCFRPSASAYTHFAGLMFSINASGTHQGRQCYGQRMSAADVDAIRFLFDSGNIASGEFRLYGLRNA